MWSFSSEIETKASRKFAWDFWSNVENWVNVDPAIIEVRLEGTFSIGGQGVTVTKEGDPVRWEIVNVIKGSQAEIMFPVPRTKLLAKWVFSSSPTLPRGCKISQVLSLHGELAKDYEAAVSAGMEGGVPEGMERLRLAIDQEFDQACRNA
ncbi:hypothetical protein OG985_47355 [Streptomyces sp. NBC_00289]|uniref:SRPBCC family protein n=1 Tax=Streptomyces sp. NBC_00289 TaxID=2975703 RepID=UPI003255CA98